MVLEFAQLMRITVHRLKAGVEHRHAASQSLRRDGDLNVRDIGKISVPDNILSNRMRCERDDFEMAKVWEQLKRHSVWGAEFLAGRQGFELAGQVARWHHESWDGSGYRLIGEQIPERVAIVTVADAYDAMTSHRP